MEVKYKDLGESILIRICGDSPRIRVIDIFLTNPYFDFSREELSNELGMSKQTVYDNIKALEESGMVKNSRRIGRAVMYRIDLGHPFVKLLNKSVNAASYATAEIEQAKEEETPVTTQKRKEITVEV